MGGPIVRTGATPEFRKNWDNVFGDKKKKTAKKVTSAKATKKTAKKAKKSAKKKAAKR